MPDFKSRQQPNERSSNFIEDICTDTWEPVYRFIYYKVQNREEAEDTTQETYVKAIASLGDGCC
jgi:RNA polymerase sigma-70 factor, ECF subfamily